MRGGTSGLARAFPGDIAAGSDIDTESALDSSCGAQYDVFADGQRFVMPEPVGEPPPATIRVVQNWFEEFRDQQSGSE